MESAAPSLPLARWAALHTDDPGRARQHLSTLFRPHRIRLGTRDAGFEFRHHRADLGGVSLNALHYGAEVTVDAPTPADSYLVKFTLHGASEVRQGVAAYTTLPGTLCVLNPTRGLLDHMSADFDMLVVQVDGTLLRAALAEDFGVVVHSPLEFALRPHRLADSTGRFEQLVSALCAELDCRDGAAQPNALRQPLVRTLASLLLSEVPHNYTARLPPADAGLMPRCVRAVEEFIAAHLAEPIGLDDLLAASGTSARTLQSAFLRHRGTTPMRYLRDRRLDRARAELKLRPDTRVTDVALRSGFTHFGKFAQRYRQRFGEAPSLTRGR